MDSEYEIWFWDPRALVHGLIVNPDFKDEFDYAPFHEYNEDGNHCFHDFMSGDWTWKQAVQFTLFALCILLSPNPGSDK